MHEIEVPSPSASMEHFRTEVAHRAARQAQRDRRLVGGSVGVGLVVVLAVTLLAVGPGTPSERRASSAASRASAPTVPSPSGRLPRGSASSGAAPGAGGMPHFSPSNSAAGGRCPPHAVCLSADVLAAGLNSQSVAAATTTGRPPPFTLEVGSVNLPSDRTLEFTLSSSASKQWGVPKIARGTALKRRSSHVSADGVVTTDFVPVARSGTAVLTVSCAGAGCQSSSYGIEVTVAPAATKP